MLKSKPTGANEDATVRWILTNLMTVEMFKAYWQNVSPDLPFPGSQAGDAASYTEWTDKYGSKCQGMRNAAGQKHGIVRIICKYGSTIEEVTWYENKRHGLYFRWSP